MTGVLVIVNRSAGGGRAGRLEPKVAAELRALGVPHRVVATRDLAHAAGLARDTLETGEVAAALGGDGLARAVADEVRRGDGMLAVLPGGRGNDFARVLGIGGNAVRACRVLRDGRERVVDVAEVEGRAALGIVSAGFDSDVLAITSRARLPLGDLVYAYGALRALAAWRPAAWTVVVDGRAIAFRGYAVAVANSGVYGGGMRLAPDARLDDGVLDVVLSEDRPKHRFLVNLPRLFSGTHVHEPGLHVLPAREVAIAADRPFVAYADGEPIAELPLTVRVLPGALRVLAP